MRLLPRDESFFDYFEKQGRKTAEGCRAFQAMVETPGDVIARAKAISELEHECDQITHAVVQHLRKTFITPLDHHAARPQRHLPSHHQDGRHHGPVGDCSWCRRQPSA